MKLPRLSFSIIYGIYTGLMPLIMSGLASFWIYENVESLKTIGLFQMVIIWIGFSLAMGLSIIPTTFVALISGYIWGLNSILPLIGGYILATIIGANLSKWIDNDQILNQINKNPKAKVILERLKNEEFKIIALARLSPIFPFGISNVIFTYMGIKLPKLLLAGIIGMLPRTLFMVWAASKATAIDHLFKSNWQQYLNSPIFYLGIVSVLVLLGIVFKAINQKK